jgi:hypothetical protein
MQQCRQRTSRGAVLLLAALFLCTAASCATAPADRTSDIEGNENARCVITDRAGNEVVVKECVVRMGPEGTPRSVQLPIHETQTKAPWGELTYPLNFEVRIEKGKGLVFRLKGTSFGEDDAEPEPETPELGTEEEEADPEVPVRKKEAGETEND